MADKIKFSAAILLVIAAVAAFYYFSEVSVLWRGLGLLLAIIGAGFIAALTAPGRQVMEFFKEAQIEVRKVVWPTRKETMQTTLVVMVMVVVIAVFLWLLDMALLGSVKMLTGQGG